MLAMVAMVAVGPAVDERAAQEYARQYSVLCVLPHTSKQIRADGAMARVLRLLFFDTAAITGVYECNRQEGRT